MTEEERAELARLREIEQAEQAAEVARRDALVAADRGRMWEDGPPKPPRPPRIAHTIAINERGEQVVEAGLLDEERWEQAGGWSVDYRSPTVQGYS